MNRPLLSRVTLSNRRHTLVCGGDSITLNHTLGVNAYDFWPTHLETKLRRLATPCAVQVRNFGISGNTTANLRDRIHTLMQFEIPDVALLMIGVNDPGASIAQAVTQANIEACIRALRNGVGLRGDPTRGVVAGQASLPADLPIGVRYLVVSDTSTTGGAATISGQPATVTGTLGGSPAAIWYNRTGRAGEAGWARVADDNTLGVQRVMVVSTHFLNFTAAGDTPGAQNASYASVRVAQAAAAAAQGVAYFNLWQFQADLITNGFEVQGSNSWNYTADNQHPSPHGSSIMADGILTGLQAQAGWIGALQA